MRQGLAAGSTPPAGTVPAMPSVAPGFAPSALGATNCSESVDDESDTTSCWYVSNSCSTNAGAL